jgi:hypothetical protein
MIVVFFLSKFGRLSPQEFPNYLEVDWEFLWRNIMNSDYEIVLVIDGW